MKKVNDWLKGFRTIITVWAGYIVLYADFLIGGLTGFNKEALKGAESNLQYDQLIHEFGRWVHIGFDDNNRRQNLTASRGQDGKTIYSYGHQEVKK